jgi:hypothetical protein
MDGETVFALLFLISLGFWFIYGGLLFHLGYWRSWYLTPDTIFGARLALYGLVPYGLAAICLVITFFLPTVEIRRTIDGYVILPLCILGIVLTFWRPRWLTPKWLWWLEKNSSDILDLIVEEGRKTKDWGKVVATQQGLELWVAQVREKHKTTLDAAPVVIYGLDRSSLRRLWPIGLVIVAVSSGIGQYLLGNGLIGFIVSLAILGFIYLVWAQE